MKLLVVSNGHGEDTIAVKIIEQLQFVAPQVEVYSLPMVGEGFAYQRANIPIISPVKTMPSGGFVYMDNKQLWGDVKQGLIDLIWEQYKVVRQWGKEGAKILAVGDILPLLFAWLSGADYGFVGTAKSEYYIRDEYKWLDHGSKLDRLLGSVYYPWERWLMRCDRCMAVFPRDTITAKTLQGYGINAFDVGNPMMDGIGDHCLPDGEDNYAGYLKVLLLPGSRMPEALDNWRLILTALDSLSSLSEYRFLFISAIAPSLNIEKFTAMLDSQWHLKKDGENPRQIRDQEMIKFSTKNSTLIVSQNAYGDCLHYADLAIAMAGTATEQFVGLGKSAIAIVGKGPQYNRKFARNQTYLLGESVQLIDTPEEIQGKLKQLVQNRDHWHKIATNGQKRMGKSGASPKIAHHLVEKLIN